MKRIKSLEINQWAFGFEDIIDRFEKSNRRQIVQIADCQHILHSVRWTVVSSVRKFIKYETN